MPFFWGKSKRKKSIFVFSVKKRIKEPISGYLPVENSFNFASVVSGRTQ